MPPSHQAQVRLLLDTKIVQILDSITASVKLVSLGTQIEYQKLASEEY